MPRDHVTLPLRSEKYEVIVVSPRNYFLYTPLLPAVATGTMEERSIVEPVRNLLQGKVRRASPPTTPNNILRAPACSLCCCVHILQACDRENTLSPVPQGT